MTKEDLFAIRRKVVEAEALLDVSRDTWHKNRSSIEKRVQHDMDTMRVELLLADYEAAILAWAQENK